MAGYILTALVFCLIGFVYGAFEAGQKIANDTERYGGFYIGKKWFKCEKVEGERNE